MNGNKKYVVICFPCLLIYFTYMIMVLIAYDCTEPTTHPKRLMMIKYDARYIRGGGLPEPVSLQLRRGRGLWSRLRA